jgi:hypothetical protein
MGYEGLVAQNAPPRTKFDHSVQKEDAMKAAKTFMTAVALATGLALPFFVAAQLSGQALDAEAAERIERGVEQLDSDSHVVRELGFGTILKEGESALPLLRDRADAAKRNGNIDLETRIRDAIGRIEAEVNRASGRDAQQAEPRQNRVVIQPSAFATKSTTWIENGKVTSIEQDANGKITLKVTENGNETVESFDNEEAFRSAHPELARRFAGNSSFNFRFSGPFGRGGVNEAELDLPDPFELFRQRPAQRGTAEELADLKERVAELRGLAEGLGESGEAVRKKVAEVDEAIKKLEGTLPATPRVWRAPTPGENPFRDFDQMFEEARKQREEMLRRFHGGNDPFERFRRPGAQEPTPQSQEKSEQPPTESDPAPAPTPEPGRQFPERKPGDSSDF